MAQENSLIEYSDTHTIGVNCALYLRQRFHHLAHATFTVVRSNESKHDWCLYYNGNLDRVKNELDTEYSRQVKEVAKAFITGAGGLAMRSGGIVF